jgi:hypothetical protein
MLRNRHSLRPSLEALEARDTPAGTVTATFTAGRLTITGDAADNTLLIRSDWDGCLVISGNGSGTVVRLNGGAAGEDVKLPTPLTGAVTIALGDGADSLTIDGADFPGSLTINGGNGAPGGPTGNTIDLSGGVLVGGNLNITNLAGSDTINLSGIIGVGGAMTIRNGPGGSLLSVVPNTVDLHVGGLFSVSGGAGYDKVDMWDSLSVSVGGIAFNSGPDAAGGYYRIHALNDLTVAGSVRMTNGGGEDRDYLGAGTVDAGGNLAVGGAVVIQNGDGDSFSTLLSWGTLSLGQVTITNGVGWHDNTIHSYDKTVIRGGVTFSNGPGERTFNTIQGNNLLSVGGNISFVNGASLDFNGVGGNDTHVGGSITVRSGNGGSTTSVTAHRLLYIGGPTKITSGDGKDLVYIGPDQNELDSIPVVDIGSVTVNNGDGGSETAIVASRLTVRGSVNVSAWDGTDQVAVASETDSGTISGNVAIDIGPGEPPPDDENPPPDQLVGVAAANDCVLTIGGSLGIWADDSDAPTMVALANVNVRSWTDVFTGDGTDQLIITASTFGGAFDLDTGGAQDLVQIEPNGNVTYFRGPVWVDMGAGDDAIALGGDPESGGLVVFAGETTWDGGAGWDLLFGRNFGAIFYGPEPEVIGYEAAA